jgi:aminoglycoside 3'-phosphotransferase-2
VTSRAAAPPAFVAGSRALRRRFGGYDWTPITTGRSGDRVFRLAAAGRAALVVKCAAADRVAVLTAERDRLAWLAGTGVASAAVVDFVDDGDGHGAALVTTCLPGRDLVASDLPVAAKVEMVAAALAGLHRLDPAGCPFDETAPTRLARAGRWLAAGWTDAADLDAARGGRSGPEFLADLAATRPATEDLVVVHGDPCLPNLIGDDGRFAGFVDCGRLGRADRWHDLALAAGSIARRLGAGPADRFFAAYGVATPDLERIAWHRALDAFF